MTRQTPADNFRSSSHTAWQRVQSSMELRARPLRMTAPRHTLGIGVGFLNSRCANGERGAAREASAIRIIWSSCYGAGSLGSYSTQSFAEGRLKIAVSTSHRAQDIAIGTHGGAVPDRMYPIHPPIRAATFSLHVNRRQIVGNGRQIHARCCERPMHVRADVTRSTRRAQPCL